MAIISTKEISANLEGVLARVAQGEEFTILQQDRPVARLLPLEATNGEPGDRDAIIDRLLEFGKGRFLGSTDIRELIEEGRM